MSEAVAAAAAPKKGNKKLLIIGGLAIVLVGAGGVGAGLYAGGGSGGHEEEENLPELVLREGAHGDTKALKHGKSPDPTVYKATYYPIEQQFTSNLRDSDGFVQVGLGVSTYYDERVTEAVKLHEMAIRSAVLMTLANQDIETVASPKGKETLQHDLTKAINAVLEEKEGFGGIDDVYFTSFVIQ